MVTRWQPPASRPHHLATKRWSLGRRPTARSSAGGLEGTGSYGAALALFLAEAGHKVVEVTRPDRAARRHKGKSDTVDAEAAARAVQAGDALAEPKAHDGAVETIRALRIVRSSAIKARTQAINEMKDFIVTAPAQLREELRSLSRTELVEVCSKIAPDEVTTPLAGVRYALGMLARRIVELCQEVKALERHLDRLVAEAAPSLVAIFGVGTETAGQFLVTAGDNPDRLRSEGSFAKLCGVAPLEASSGKVVRHRLNRGGDRQANCALYRVVIVRMGTDERTKEYVRRRTAEGKSKKEIIRSLKRFVAREIYAALLPKSVTTPAAAAA